MPPGRRGGKRKRTASRGAGRGGIDVLPDDVLHHVLSFLPAQEAVRTCVLARRWRHLWKSATGLRISCGDDEEAESVKELRKFVDPLLRLRRGSALNTCELHLFEFDWDDTPRVNLWIRHVLRCNVRVLSLCLDADCWFELFSQTLISQHLKKLQLTFLRFNDSSLEFSSCPALEDLEFNTCYFSNCRRISSQSLKRLSFDSDCSYGDNYVPRIDVQNLISLRLEVSSCRTPLLQRMPSLVEAVVKIRAYFGEACYGHCYCYSVYGDTNKCMLLQGLSEAQSLVLISDIKILIFRRDLKWCPIFGNLKTLLLNEYWCMPPDFSLLTCILEHSPVLEKLTLQLFCKGPKSKVKMEGSPDPTQGSNAISKHLKIVEVKCEVVDDKVLEVLKFLSTLGIRMNEAAAHPTPPPLLSTDIDIDHRSFKICVEHQDLPVIKSRPPSELFITVPYWINRLTRRG